MRLNRFLLTILTLLISTIIAYANVVPSSISDIPKNTIGVYQTDKYITIHSKPDKDSEILYERELNYSTMLYAKIDNMFAILVPNKELGYMYALDATDDWVQVIYDKTRNLKGWVYKTDDFQFLTWGDFINMYGRKYGLIQLKNSAISLNEIHSQPETNSQIIGRMNRPRQIRLTSIEGNWALVSILDVTSNTYTGYVQWRDLNGQFYLFPDIK